MTTMRVLLVEDEPSIAEPLVAALQREGHEVHHAPDGASALAAPEAELVLLDLRLPDIDGFDVCRALRARSTVPIIILSARGEEIDKVLGLELGADDYLVKPFGVRELLARMHAVTRRTQAAAAVTGASVVDDDALQLGVLVVDLRAHRVSVAGSEVELTPTEFELLVAFARRPGAAYGREQLLADVWNTSWSGSTKTVDVHVASLRRKLGDQVQIDTIRGIGYRLVAAP
ncbi:MAG: DNA-binding response regulator [Thermoleophilia bacterium]|nr:DNA-binding response regulator [Thermoleophilia bacterium]